MRWSRTFIPTSKHPPAEARVASHQLMARAGLIRGERAGVFQFLPLGFRCLRKLEAICRGELESAGCWQTLWPEKGHSLEGLAECLRATFARPGVPVPTRTFQVLQKSYEVPKPRGGLLEPCESVACQAFSFAVGEPGAGGARDEAGDLRPAFERILRRCGVPWVTAEDDTSAEDDASAGRSRPGCGRRRSKPGGT